jgi:hypothetical protein
MPATKRAIDMTNVKDAPNVNPKRKPEGDYKLKVIKVEDHKSSAGNDGWMFTLQLAMDSRATYAYYCGFDDKQAWKIRNLCVAAGLAVPKKKVMVDPNRLLNKEIGGTLEDDEYEGKVKSTVSAVFPVSELSGDAPEDDSTDGGSDDDVDEMDLEEL